MADDVRVLDAASNWVSIVGPTGPQGAPGGSYLSATWTFNQTTTPPPVSGGLRFNATSFATTTLLYISETDRDGLDRNAGLNVIAVGDQVMVQSAQGRGLFNVTSVADSGTYRTIGVTLAESSGTRPSASAITTVYIITTRTPLPARTTASKTTASLAAGASESGTIALDKAYRLYTIATNAPARVRLYTTAAKATADLSRPVGTDPINDHGCLLDFVTTAGLLSADLSPLVDGFDGKTTPDGAIPVTVTNTGAAPAAVQVNFIWRRTE